MTGMSQYSAHAVHSNSSISDAVESKSTIYDWSQNTVEPYSTICDCSYYCVSSSVVNFIQCSLCNCVYVGETGCKVRERMNQHRFDISRHNDTPVAAHFSLPGHNLQISVLQSTQDSVIMRRLIERTWISRIRSMPGYFVINRNDGISILQL